MKKLLLLVAILGLIVQSQAQSISSTEVPASVKTVFTKTHPKATSVRWHKSGNTFESKFTENGEKKSATFDNRGVLIKDEESIVIAALPAAATAYIDSKYKGNKIKKASRMLGSNGVINYQAEVAGLNLLFDVHGKFLKSVKD